MEGCGRRARDREASRDESKCDQEEGRASALYCEGLTNAESETEREVLIRLRAATIELINIDEESGGAIDLSLAIEHLQRAIRELESSR